MNKLLFFAAIFSLGLPLAPAQLTTTSSLTRESYADRASQELRNLRQQIEAVDQRAPLVEQSQFAPYRNALLAAEQALAEIKTAPQIELTTRQAAFEQAKARAIQLWNDFQTASSPAARQPTTENPAAETVP